MSIPDPVVYTVRIEHWADGTVGVEVYGVGDSPHDRESIAWALRKAAHKVETCESKKLEQFS